MLLTNVFTYCKMTISFKKELNIIQTVPNSLYIAIIAIRFRFIFLSDWGSSWKWRTRVMSKFTLNCIPLCEWMWYLRHLYKLWKPFDYIFCNHTHIFHQTENSTCVSTLTDTKNSVIFCPFSIWKKVYILMIWWWSVSDVDMPCFIWSRSKLM